MNNNNNMPRKVFDFLCRFVKNTQVWQEDRLTTIHYCSLTAINVVSITAKVTETDSSYTRPGLKQNGGTQRRMLSIRMWFYYLFVLQP